MKRALHIIAAAVLVCGVLIGIFFPRALVHIYEPIRETLLLVHEPAPSILFVGDVMLGRHVDRLMEEYGADYPFERLGAHIASYDISVANFEAVVPTVNVPTASGGMQFSVRESNFEKLVDVGFDVLSFANNHSADHGQAALDNTRALCREYGIVCGGTPRALSEESVRVVEVGDVRVGILFIHTLFVAPDMETLEELTDKLEAESDMQVAYIHWGNEYELTDSPSQERLAHTLADAGIDVVIGHHPHVVQNIELYKNTPIIYSLGNFIFDQYFSTDVQEGLMVGMEIEKEDIVLTLMGVTSKEARSQPARMTAAEEEKLLTRILAPHAGDARIDLLQGTITILR